MSTSIAQKSMTESHWAPEQRDNLARTLKALAHPARLAILDMLYTSKRLTVTEIYTRLNADQSAVSHHLSLLRARDIVGTERNGKFIFYFLRNPEYLSLIECLSTGVRPASGKKSRAAVA